jgi:predicted transcriptional regulator
MAHKYAELRAKLSPKEKKISGRLYAQHVEQMALNELREALDLTQEQLAELMKVSQVAISRLERRPDMYVSTLRRVIEAMGGEMEIRAVLPKRTVKLQHLG